MAFEKLRELLRLNNALIDAEKRKHHSESRLVEIMNRKHIHPALRRQLIERLGEDIYTTEREIIDLRDRLDAMKEATA